MIKVAIVQYRLLHYRLRLFELLRTRLNSAGVELQLIHGQASKTERSRNDEGKLAWATPVRNLFLRIGGKDLVWQPLPASARDAALVVVMQENRLLSNYWLQLRRALGGPRVAFWGHGRNYQSTAPSGLRESWKTWWLRRVDWWFAYTDGSRRFVVQHGFAADQITTLNNAIDGSGFERDLLTIAPDDIARAAAGLGIDADAQVAIYCGSIYAEKRIGVLLQSADLLRQQLPGFHLLVVGEGPESGLMKAAAATRPWLHMLGPRKGREKALYYRLAQVMLNPGLVGLHVVDAFVAQTPLVTQVSALHSPEYDYLVDGKNGRAVADDSAQAYADAVTQIFVAPGVLAAMRAQCAADAKNYTLENMAANFADGIVECLVRDGLLQLPGKAHA